MEQQDKEKRMEEDFGDQPPLQPPISEGRFSKFNMGGEKTKSAIISFIVTFVMLFLMSFAGGIWFVTKTDFTNNMANVVTTIDQAKADLAKAKSDVATAVQNVPTTINNQVSTSISHYTSEWNNQLSSVSDRVTTLDNLYTGVNNQVSKLLTTTNNQATEIINLQTINTELETRVAVLETKLSSMEVKVLDFEKRIAELEGNPVTPSVTGVVASFYNSPMYWTNGLVGATERSFGLKISNGTAQSLIYVNLTVTLQSSFPLSYFITNPTLTSDSGIIWEYTQGIGQTFKFDGKGYIWVPANSEFAGLQKLTINTGSYAGVYTISVTSVVINSKTLQ